MSRRKSSRKKKTRKPKFLSLRRRLAAAAAVPPPSADCRSDHQLELLPLQPADQNNPLLKERAEDDDHVSCLLATDLSDGGAAALHDLLGAAAAPTEASASEESVSPSSSSANYGAVSCFRENAGLARVALRGREKWVFAAEEEEEASSVWCGETPGGLSLKLDYDEVMNSWSDDRPLYVEGEAPQIVPELYPLHSSTCSTVFVDVMGCTRNSVGNSLWTVPDGRGNGDVVEIEADQHRTDEERVSREARVMRYKEKRRNRMFSKRIRYEVRKLNAQKRPRMKGRFVKRNDDG